MKFKKSILVMISILSILSIGCTKEDVVTMEEIENHIPYMENENGEIDYMLIDNTIIDKRYETTNKEELTYKSLYHEEHKHEEHEKETIPVVYPAGPIKDDVNYKAILQGFSYASEINPCDLSYDEALDLVTKILPNDIEKVKSVMDTEVNKEYIYYKSEKGNFRVGLCRGYVMTDEGETVDDNLVVGIDYSMEFE